MLFHNYCLVGWLVGLLFLLLCVVVDVVVDVVVRLSLVDLFVCCLCVACCLLVQCTVNRLLIASQKTRERTNEQTY